MSRRRLITLFVIVFVNFLGGTIVLPTLPLYSQRHFGASPETISFLLASYFVAQFLAAPVLGRVMNFNPLTPDAARPAPLPRKRVEGHISPFSPLAWEKGVRG